MSKQQEYIDSVDGAAHMSAVRIIAELEAALTAAKERGRTLNDELYYACELAIAYTHSEKDKEWAAKRIEELMPPEQEAADESV